MSMAILEIYTPVGCLAWLTLMKLWILVLYIYPVESRVVLENLRKKVTRLEAGIQIDNEKGRVRDPAKQAAILDAEEMRDKLQVGEERSSALVFISPFMPAIWKN